jgi:thioredoxin 1
MGDFFVVTETNFEAEVISSQLPVLLEFGAPWCQPCKQLEPLLFQLAQQWQGKMKLVKVDVDESADLAMRYGVMGVPTTILFVNGEVKARLTGFQSRNKLEEKFGAMIGG